MSVKKAFGYLLYHLIGKHMPVSAGRISFGAKAV